MTPNLFIPTSASSQTAQRTGTPPLSRNSSSSSYPKRSSVVPFTRPGQRRSNDESGGSYSEHGSISQPVTPAFRSRRQSSGQGLPRSLDDYSFSQSPATSRRSESEGRVRRDRGPPPVVREEGFNVSAIDERCSSASGASLATEGSPSGQGLLSKHFSGSLPVGSPTPSEEILKERLQRCIDQPSAQRLPAVESDGAARRILTRLQAHFDVFNDQTVLHAFRTASAVLRSHHEMGSGSPPIVHNLETAAILAELGASAACISAALLHGVIERRAMSEGQLRDALQPDVSSLVLSAARMSDLCKVRQQAAIHMDAQAMRKFSHMLLAMADVQAVVIVLAERLQMLRGGDFSPAEARDVLDVFTPLADQLGVWSLKAELEDLAFLALHPKEHAELRGRLQESMQNRTIERSLDALKEAVASRGITNVHLSGRPKNLYSIHKKMGSKGYGLEQLYDVRALRIVTRSKADCYQVLREVEQMWGTVQGRDKDYIRSPKQNGYQSLHTVVIADDGVPMEVQIRTDKMHFIAEYGVAAHWRYKEDAMVWDYAREQQVAWARMLICWQLELTDKKLRPAGSPAHDSALSHICPFPRHDDSCPASNTAGFLARHAPRPQDQNGNAHVPVYVIVLDHMAPRGRDAMSIKELPAHSTVAQLHELLQLQEAAAGRSRAATRLLVNGVEPTRQQLLKVGDKVEVLSTLPMVGTHLTSPAGQQPLTEQAHITHSIGALSLDHYSPHRLSQQTAALRN